MLASATVVARDGTDGAATFRRKRWGTARRARHSGGCQVPEERVELSRGCPRGILSPLRLPFRHSGAVLPATNLAAHRARRHPQGRPSATLDSSPKTASRFNVPRNATI